MRSAGSEDLDVKVGRTLAADAGPRVAPAGETHAHHGVAHHGHAREGADRLADLAHEVVADDAGEGAAAGVVGGAGGHLKHPQDS